jgi:hypothetical protein
MNHDRHKIKMKFKVKQKRYNRIGRRMRMKYLYYIKKFERNDDKRQFRIQEFIRTEKSYVDTLKTVVKYVVNPLRSSMQQKNCILNTFKCQKIFLNVDQIMKVNSEFLQDLLEVENSTATFGSLCEKHVKYIYIYICIKALSRCMSN